MKLVRSKLCTWCATGKPLHVTAFKNPGCYNCAQKPDAVDGVRLLSTAEIKAARTVWIDWAKRRAGRERQRQQRAEIPAWRCA